MGGTQLKRFRFGYPPVSIAKKLHSLTEGDGALMWINRTVIELAHY